MIYLAMEEIVILVGNLSPFILLREQGAQKFNGKFLQYRSHIHAIFCQVQSSSSLSWTKMIDHASMTPAHYGRGGVIKWSIEHVYLIAVKTIEIGD